MPHLTAAERAHSTCGGYVFATVAEREVVALPEGENGRRYGGSAAATAAAALCRSVLPKEKPITDAVCKLAAAAAAAAGFAYRAAARPAALLGLLFVAV